MINKVHVPDPEMQHDQDTGKMMWDVHRGHCLGGGARVGGVRSNGKMYDWAATRSVNNWGGGSSWGQCRRDGKGKG